MTNAGFQDRLQRLNANSPQQQSITRGVAHKERFRARKPNYRLMGLGGASIGLGVQVIKYTNENYQTIKDSSGIGTAAGLGVAGMVALLIGLILLIRAIATPAKATTSECSSNMERPVRQTSTKARIVFSLLGFVLGAIACLYMFMSAAARLVETEAATTFSIGGFFIAGLLAFVSLLFGFTGLFFRGYALGRVPMYCLFGGMISFGSFRVLGINLLEWPEFITTLQ